MTNYELKIQKSTFKNSAVVKAVKRKTRNDKRLKPQTANCQLQTANRKLPIIYSPINTSLLMVTSGCNWLYTSNNFDTA